MCSPALTLYVLCELRARRRAAAFETAVPHPLFDGDIAIQPCLLRPIVVPLLADSLDLHLRLLLQWGWVPIKDASDRTFRSAGVRAGADSGAGREIFAQRSVLLGLWLSDNDGCSVFPRVEEISEGGKEPTKGRTSRTGAGAKL